MSPQSNWSSLAAELTKKHVDLASGLNTLGRWCKQFETADKGNPSLAFLRNSQVQAHLAIACITQGLYKPAAGSIRAGFESALYYTYFRTHTSELNTLVRSPKYYILRDEVIEFHKQHTEN